MAEANAKAVVPTTSNEITAQVLTKINQFKESKELRLPADYSPENALKSAYLILSEQKDSSGNLVLNSCSKESIANALLNMVVQGLSPVKKQCYFIPYGNQLQLSRSYMGSIAIAKRIGGVKSVTATPIYQGDTFEFQIIDGRTKVTKHEQKLADIDESKLIGVYATLTLDDNSVFVEIMNMAQVEKAWMQGATKGNSPAHKNFRTEMAKKSVINRACKLFINTSDDSGLYEEEPEGDYVKAKVDLEIKNNANKTEIQMDTEEADHVVLPSVTELDMEAELETTTATPELKF